MRGWQWIMYGLLGVVLGLLGIRSVHAAGPCAGGLNAGPALIRGSQVFSDTIQPAPNLFVCRVDGATATNTSRGTREVTSTGLLLLIIARWMHFLGYALGFGSITFGLWAVHRLDNQSPHIWQIVRLGIMLLLCAEPLALLAQTLGVGNAWFDTAVAGDVLASGFGLVWAQRVGAALLLWVLIGVVQDGAPPAMKLVPLLGLVLALIDSTASVAGARNPMVSVAAATLHQAAMGVWVGGLALLLGMWTQLGDQRVAILAGFSQLAAGAIGLLIVTGIVLAILRIGQANALFSTFYGAVLLLKLAIALLAIGLALFGQPLYRTLWRWRAGLFTLILLLGIAGLLVSLPTP